jgi:1-acyl-sn-glycerol-3-phosphate acyltransferase
VFKLFFPYRCRQAKGIPSPVLVVSNHTTDLDPVLVGLSFSRQMYFVASEHVFRMRGSRLLRFFFDPILRIKGRSDAQAAIEIIRRLKGGSSVCLFAEGNRSFSGVTGPIIPSTGKLVRISGASLLTYRLRGGYFSAPRWAARMRRGPIWGAPVNYYSPEALAGMSPKEINEVIQRDIYEDAYQTQEELALPGGGRYFSSRPAEWLETALFLCPDCGRVGGLSSRGDRLSCRCGLDYRYDQQGFLHVEGGGSSSPLHEPFTTVRDWWFWQKEAVKNRGRSFSASDDNLSLFEITPGRGTALRERGRLSLGEEGLTCGSRHFFLKDIHELAILGRQTLVFSAQGKHYELRCPVPFSAAKYQCIFNFLTGR